MTQLSDQPAHGLDILLADPLHQRLDLLLGFTPPPDQLGLHQVRVVLPATVQTEPVLVREQSHYRPNLLRQTTIAVQIGQRGQHTSIQQSHHLVIQALLRIHWTTHRRVHIQLLQDNFAQPDQLVHQNRIVMQRCAQGHKHGKSKCPQLIQSLGLFRCQSILVGFHGPTTDVHGQGTLLPVDGLNDGVN